MGEERGGGGGGEGGGRGDTHNVVNYSKFNSNFC